MLVDVDSRELPADAPDPAGSFRLGAAVGDLYSDLRVNPLLQRLLGHSRDLLGTVAGSISLIDRPRGRYEKLAEVGVRCRLGQSFPLDEGATGQAVNRRMPVVIDDYSALGAGHLPTDHPASHGAVAAAPMWWRGDVIGVNVAFAGRRRTFTTAELDTFEALTQSVASAMMQAGRGVPSLAGLLREHGNVLAAGTGVQTVVTEAGAARPVPHGVAAAAVNLVAVVGRTAAARSAGARLHVAVVHRDDELRLLIQDESGADRPEQADPFGLGTRTWRELLAATGGDARPIVGVEHVPGWGTLLRAGFPTAGATAAPASAPAPQRAEAPSPLTPREYEVLALLAEGMSDREVATRLGISPKTVEKHVGAALRKTGTRSRTAAVVQAIDNGWMAAHPVHR